MRAGGYYYYYLEYYYCTIQAKQIVQSLNQTNQHFYWSGLFRQFWH